jgi:hypothetical protein
MRTPHQCKNDIDDLTKSEATKPAWTDARMPDSTSPPEVNGLMGTVDSQSQSFLFHNTARVRHNLQPAMFGRCTIIAQ